MRDRPFRTSKPPSTLLGEQSYEVSRKRAREATAHRTTIVVKNALRHIRKSSRDHLISEATAKTALRLIQWEASRAGIVGYAGTAVNTNQ
jgi:hypothetical protein